MAKAGFYRKALEGSPDNVACYMCSCTLDGWQPGDSPWEEHTRHSRMCSLVRLDLQASREMTFEIGKWRHRGVPGIGTAQMASAGFFFCPRDAADDTAVCFQCGLALDGTEHAKRRPHCAFLVDGFMRPPAAFSFLFAGKALTTTHNPPTAASEEMPLEDITSKVVNSASKRVARQSLTKKTDDGKEEKENVTPLKKQQPKAAPSSTAAKKAATAFKAPTKREDKPSVEVPPELAPWLDSPADLDLTLADFLDALKARQKALLDSPDK